MMAGKIQVPEEVVQVAAAVVAKLTRADSGVCEIKCMAHNCIHSGAHLYGMATCTLKEIELNEEGKCHLFHDRKKHFEEPHERAQEG